MLHLYSRKTAVVKEIYDTCCVTRVYFANLFLNTVRDVEILLFGYNAWLHISGYLNSQNKRQRNTEYYKGHSSSLHAVKWSGLGLSGGAVG